MDFVELLRIHGNAVEKMGREITWRPRTASKSVKLQRPASGRRVQSLHQLDMATNNPCMLSGWDLVRNR